MDDRRRERITWSVVAAGAGLLLITAYAFPTAALMVLLLVALPLGLLALVVAVVLTVANVALGSGSRS